MNDFWQDVRRRHPGFVNAVVADARIAVNRRGERGPLRPGLDTVWAVVRLAIVSDAFLAQACYRAKAALQAKGIPVVPRVLHRLAIMLGQISIGDPVVMEAGVYLPHGQVVIDGITTVSKGVMIGPFVTIGLSSGELIGPTIGRQARIGTNASVIGAVTIGAHAEVGAGAVVTRDVAPHTTVVGVPARPTQPASTAAPAPAPALAPVPALQERDVVFNVVWTGSVFTYLRYFVMSQLHFSDARFRFVANGCPPDQIEAMERFRAKRPDRIVEVLETSPEMRPHGRALDRVRRLRDDGPLFSLIDADILARGPFLAPFVDALGTAAAITSGRGVWRDDDLVPVGHPGVSGEYFYSQDGYLFGSPHFAIYHRDVLEATSKRWGLGFAEGGPGLSDETAARLRAAGHDYIAYDTGKILNILLQEDGHVLEHEEHPNLMHIGGVSHYLSPTGMVVHTEGEEAEPDWKTWRNMTTRFEVARFTATVLRSLCEGEPPPEVPDGLDHAMVEKLQRVRAALIELVGRFYAELSTE